MPSKMTDAAIRFVDLALKHQRWSEIETLPGDEVQVLFDTVSTAGFSPSDVVPGKLVGNYLDQDASPTGKTYPINSLCPFKVVGQENHDNYFATGWLDCALRRVVYGSARQNESREKLIEAMSQEIERSVPLEPIQLTAEDDHLCEYPRGTHAFGFGYFVSHTRDENGLCSCAGVHEFCNSFMDRTRATQTQDAIVCRRCHLRVLFPREVETYGDLRRALAPQRVQVPA